MKNITLPVVGPVSPVVLLALAGVAAFVLVNARAVTRAAVHVAADTVDNVITGTVEGVGEVVGVPVTNQTECQKDLAAGNTWAASFSCPAGTWLKSLWD